MSCLFNFWLHSGNLMIGTYYRYIFGLIWYAFKFWTSVVFHFCSKINKVKSITKWKSDNYISHIRKVNTWYKKESQSYSIYCPWYFNTSHVKNWNYFRMLRFYYKTVDSLKTNVYFICLCPKEIHSVTISNTMIFNKFLKELQCANKFEYITKIIRSQSLQ